MLEDKVTKDFLDSNQFMEDRLSKGIDVMPSDSEIEEFRKLAKVIDNERYFSPYGCQDCINDLVRFVYKNRGTFIKNETFPKVEKADKKKENKTK